MSTTASTPTQQPNRTPGRWRSWPVRVRLTVLYGGLFLLCGAAVLAITYTLVDQATQTEAVTLVQPDGSGFAANVDIGDPASHGDGPQTSGGGTSPGPGSLDLDQLRKLAAQQHTARMTTLLVQSSIALGIMAVVAVMVGWVMAGRVLSPLRTITATTKRITAQNLDERLALDGPADELTELGDTINGLLSRLDAAFRAQRQFVANASHELRTPLARQRTVAQVALDDPDATIESLRAAHERVLAAGVQQEHMINALLTLARAQAAIDRFEPVDLTALTRTCIESRRADADDRGVMIVADLAAATVSGDGGLIERLVTNLIDNALRHNHPEGTVQVTTDMRNGVPELTVANTGPQVPKDVLPTLAEPFRRLHQARGAGSDGHGLGLSIVNAVAEVHGATLTVDAQPSGGLHITVTWPRPDGSSS